MGCCFFEGWPCKVGRRVDGELYVLVVVAHIVVEFSKKALVLVLSA